MAIFSRIGDVLRRVVRLAARPARADHGRGGLVIQPYRGYGSREEVFLLGRVFKQPGGGQPTGQQSTGGDLKDLVRRVFRRGVGEGVLSARFQAKEERLKTDKDGYFRLRMHFSEPPPADRLWHQLDLNLIEPAGPGPRHAKGDFFVPPGEAKFVVISDIDDTVVFTGVASKVKMFWRLFMQGARSRVAFPGVGALYRALHGGASGEGVNPMLYVSRGPWSIYEVLDEFFHIHGIPVGPILFLREWGLTLQRPLPPKAEDHKVNLIHDMLSLYSNLPFVLIGDSGQHDPEIYAEVVRRHPNRIAAVYIRNVSRGEDRRRAIERLAEEVVRQGSTLLLAADSFAMAEHAAQHGLISREAMLEVLDERKREGDERPVKAVRRVEHETAEETRKAVSRGELKQAIDERTAGEEAPNVAVESREQRSGGKSEPG